MIESKTLQRTIATADYIDNNLEFDRLLDDCKRWYNIDHTKIINLKHDVIYKTFTDEQGQPQKFAEFTMTVNYNAGDQGKKDIPTLQNNESEEK